MSALITAAEAAKIIGISLVALYHHRKRETGPKWIDQRTPGTKNARPLYYRASVEVWATKRNLLRGGRSYVECLVALEARVAALEANAPELAKVKHRKMINQKRALRGSPV